MTEMPIDAPPSTNTRAVRLTEIARTFLKIGAMSYGGPAIMGITQSEVQENRGGIAKEEFVQACRVGPQARKGAGHAAAFAVRFGAGAGHGGIADRRSHSAR